MTNIVSADDLKELTGSPTAKKQMQILAGHGIKFIVRTDGKIRTTWAAVNAILAQRADATEEEPELDFLR